MPPIVHLDANAGAAVSAAAWQAWLAAAAAPAAPEALHGCGRQARARLRAAQSGIAQAIGADADSIRLVSGGTEADALALSVVCPPVGAPSGAQAPLPHVLTTGIEHAAVSKTLEAWAAQGRLSYDVIPAGRTGVVDAALVAQAITPATRLVSMTWACNETGVLQPVAQLAALCRAKGVLLHTDAVQAVGRVAVDVATCGADMLSLSGHKLGAVGGIGALWVRPGTPAMSLYADSTAENVPGAASLAAALAALPSAAAWAQIGAQRDALEHWAQHSFGAHVEVLGGGVERLPNTSCMRFVDCSGEAMMMALDVAGFAVATGSACSTGAVEPSPLLMGMGLSAEQAQQAIRLSFAAPIEPAAMAALQQALMRAQRALAGRRF